MYKIPLFYIAFQQNTEKEEMYRSFGFTNVNHFKAINGRKLDLRKLYEDNLISGRAYYDLIIGRENDIGHASKGSLGCTLSHYSLWKKCIEMKMPIIIAEEDNVLFPISNEVENEIMRNVSKEKVFFSTNNIRKGEKGSITFVGLHFYIVTPSTAKILVDHALPIDVTCDSYISHLISIGVIQPYFKAISDQVNESSSIQSVCVNCVTLPLFPFFFVTFVIMVIILLYYAGFSPLSDNR